ncbi:hypothetical protein [Alicyclobacillus dauci]|uniref:Nucleotidyltransferase domain-containing protein n=1 Tax=Alicyclobacillus dauci TaxID=1475485 RepID=A0ABY6YZU8_9BACL|nr:hypothetical protein [Alicyclobacillus dauci]WAH36106.1 hypothetical protein NZD86_17920 [Alicyclobacillus dauci]
MFTEVERDRLLDQLTETARGIDGIKGHVLVDSGAFGYRDQYSDLDVLVVGERAWQQYVKTKANFAVKVPDDIKDDTARKLALIKSEKFNEEDYYDTFI